MFAYVHIALRLVRESDSISRSSDSFRLNASRIAPSSAREFEAGFVSCPVILSLIFRTLPSAYHTPIPAVAFSHPLLTADPSVAPLIFEYSQCVDYLNQFLPEEKSCSIVHGTCHKHTKSQSLDPDILVSS